MEFCKKLILWIPTTERDTRSEWKNARDNFAKAGLYRALAAIPCATPEICTPAEHHPFLAEGRATSRQMQEMAMPHTNQDDFDRLNTREVCAKLNIGRTRLYTMLDTGQLPAPIKDGGRNFWPLFVIRNFIRDQWNNRFGGGEAV